MATAANVKKAFMEWLDLSHNEVRHFFNEMRARGIIGMGIGGKGHRGPSHNPRSVEITSEQGWLALIAIALGRWPGMSASRSDALNIAAKILALRNHRGSVLEYLIETGDLMARDPELPPERMPFVFRINEVGGEYFVTIPHWQGGQVTFPPQPHRTIRWHVRRDLSISYDTIEKMGKLFAEGATGRNAA